MLPAPAAPAPAAPARRPAATGTPTLAGRTVGELLRDCAPQCDARLGVILEHLDQQAGVWQYSLDDGAHWSTVRTDILNRPAPMGLALSAGARLRVQPFAGSAHRPARIVLHAAQRAVGAGDGCYGAYDADGRDSRARSFTLMLALATINDTPAGAPAARPRNKRALAAQRSLS